MTKDAYYEHMSSRMADWEAAITQLAAIAAGTKTGARQRAIESVSALERPLGRLRLCLEKLRAASDIGWERLQDDAERAWAELRDAAHWRDRRVAA